jgi:hypothetical protein
MGGMTLSADSQAIVNSLQLPTTAGTSGAVPTGDGYLGTSQQCVALVQALAPDVGKTTTWVQGTQVQGSTDLAIGTPIATFLGPNGTYSGTNQHAGLYMGQDSGGMYILEQYAPSATAPGAPSQVRYIPWSGVSGSSSAINQGQNYYVITH